MRPCVAKTTINDPREFRLSKRLTNLPALRQIGFAANRRLLGVQRLSHNPIRAAEAFTAVHQPILTDIGARIPGLRLGDRRAHALLQALLMFRLLPAGFANRRPTPPARRPSRHTRDHRRSDELRPATAPCPRPDHPHPTQSPLPAHRDRAAPRHAAQPHPDPAATSRPGSAHRPRPTRTQHPAHPSLPATTNKPSINSPSKPDSPPNPQLDSIFPTSSDSAT